MSCSKWLLAGCTISLLALAGAAEADEVILKNGDRITGKIVSAAGGELVLAPDFAPSSRIAVPQGEVATFAAAAPVVLKLKDGTVLNQAVARGDAGRIVVGPDGPLAPQPIDLQQVELINPAPPPPPAWHGALGANGLYSSAKTSSLLFGVSATGTRATASDQLTVHAGYNYGRQSAGGIKTTNADNWSAGAKYNFFFTPQVYGYVGAEAFADKVNALSLRFTPSAGAGYRWIDRSDFHFTTDAGLAWVYEDYRTRPEATKTAAVSLSYHVDKSWSAGRVAVFHDLQVLPALGAGGKVLAIADAGLRTNLTASMYSEIRGDLTYDNHPAPGAKSTSSQLRIGLGWTY